MQAPASCLCLLILLPASLEAQVAVQLWQSLQKGLSRHFCTMSSSLGRPPKLSCLPLLPGACTHFSEERAFEFALVFFAQFNHTGQGSICSQAIMLITDGAVDTYDTIFAKYNWPDRKVGCRRGRACMGVHTGHLTHG